MTEGRQSSNLVQTEGIDFIGGTRHGSASESDQIRISRVCSDGHAALTCRPHRRQHDLWVACMKAAGDIGAGDIVQDMSVIAQCPRPETLAYVTIEVNCHAHGSTSRGVTSCHSTICWTLFTVTCSVPPARL